MDITQSVEFLQRLVYKLQTNLRIMQQQGIPLYSSQGATIEMFEKIFNSMK